MDYETYDGMMEVEDYEQRWEESLETLEHD